MIILNESCKVDADVAAEFTDFVQAEYIPKMVATGCYTNGRISKIVEPIFAAEEGETFVIQFFADTEADYLRWKEEHKQQMSQILPLAFGQRAASFQTVMHTLA